MVVRRDTQRGRGGGGGPRRAAASCSPARASSTSTAASRWGRARSRSPCGWSSARPTARSPTRRSPSAATTIEAGARRDRREAPCLGIAVAVIGASGFGGALCAHLVDRHPSLELAAATARTEAGRRHDEIYPRYGVRAGPRGVRPRRDRRASRRSARGLPAQGGGAGRQGAARARPQGRGPVGGLPPRPESYERWYQPHEAPELLAEAVYGLPESHREEIREASLVAGPGLQLDRGPAGRAAAPRAYRGRRVRHQGGRLRRRARGHGGDPLLVGRRERERLRGGGPPPQRGDRAGARARRGSASSPT